MDDRGAKMVEFCIQLPLIIQLELMSEPSDMYLMQISYQVSDLKTSPNTISPGNNQTRSDEVLKIL